MPSLPARSNKPAERPSSPTSPTASTEPLPPSSRRRLVVRKIQGKAPLVPAKAPSTPPHEAFPLTTRRAVHPPLDSQAPPSSHSFRVKPLSAPHIEPVAVFDEDSEQFFEDGEHVHLLDDDEEDDDPADPVLRRKAHPAVEARRQKLVRGVAAVVAFAAGISIFAGGSHAAQALLGKGGAAEASGAGGGSVAAHMRATMCNR